MIHDAASGLAERGFSVERELKDAHGTIGYVLSFMGDEYTLVAKEYAYSGLASFMTRVVSQSSPSSKLLFYCRDDDSYTVFDLDYVKKNADPSQGPSKKRDCSWREIPLSKGAQLDSFIRGESSPATLAGGNSTLGKYA